MRQESDGDAVGGKGFAEKALVLRGHDSKERALSGPVETQDADLCAEVEREPDVVEDLDVGRMNLPETLHGVDELRHRKTIYNLQFTIDKAMGDKPTELALSIVNCKL